MATLSEIEAALKLLEATGTPRNRITVLHCNTEYPTPMVDVNLRAMCTIRDTFDVAVGYSDHTLGIEVVDRIVGQENQQPSQHTHQLGRRQKPAVITKKVTDAGTDAIDGDQTEEEPTRLGQQDEALMTLQQGGLHLVCLHIDPTQGRCRFVRCKYTHMNSIILS